MVFLGRMDNNGVKKEARVAIIIQARMGSSRFPGKVMADIEGKPLLERLVDNLRLSKRADDIIIATSDLKENNIIEEFAIRKGVSFFRGDEDDVLGRFLSAAEKFGVDEIIRVCADSPLADPEEIDSLIEAHVRSGKDYSTNSPFIHKGLPFRLEIFSRAFLRKLGDLTKDRFWKEHVTDVVLNSKEQFDINLVEPDIVRPDLMLDVDEEKDVGQIRDLYKNFFEEGSFISHKQIADFIDGKKENYHDFVIKDGKFIGQFEEMYQKCKDPWHQDEKQVAEDVALSLLRNREYGRVLDIGCGKGRFTDLIKEVTKAEVIGVDISKTAVDLAREKYEGIKFLDMEVPDLDFGDDEFDLVVCSELLWYVLPKMKDLFLEIKRVLKRGGHFLIVQHFYSPEDQKYGREFMQTSKDLIEMLPFEVLQKGEVNKDSGYKLVALCENNKEVVKGKKAVCIIPSHLGSQRFERKALADLEGLPMIVHVFKRAELAENVDGVYVATCDEEIRDVVEGYGGKVIMTSNQHKTGSDRIAEAAEKIDCDFVVNVQGDEPLVDPKEIDSIVGALKDNPDTPCANLVCLTHKKEDIGEGKVIFNKNNEVLYYSREDIPTGKMGIKNGLYKFCGVFGFTKDFLLNYGKMEQTPLEIAEFFEYNRIIEHGFKIKAVLTDQYSASVDYLKDLENVKELMKKDKIKFEYMR